MLTLSNFSLCQAIDSAFEEHDADNERSSMARHKAEEMLRRKAAKLKEISHEEKMKVFHSLF